MWTLWVGVALANPCGPAPLAGARGLGGAPAEESCLFTDLDLGVRGFQHLPDDGDDRGVVLQRARIELGAHATSNVQARFAFLEARSGAEPGVGGVNGDAWMPVLQIAEARWDWQATGLAIAGGIVDDPWTMTVQPVWGRREISSPLPTASGAFTRSDEGVWVGWSAPDRLVSTTVAVLGGQGANSRDRNDEVDVAAVAVVRPANRGEHDWRPELAIHGRRGSTGPDEVRAHRFAAAAMVRHPWVNAGVDGLLGWGLGADPDARPAGISAWGRAGDGAPVTAWLRGDLSWTDTDDPATRAVSWQVGGGPRLPVGEPPGPMMLVLGYEGRDAADTVSHLLFVQVGARLIGAATLH